MSVNGLVFVVVFGVPFDQRVPITCHVTPLKIGCLGTHDSSQSVTASLDIGSTGAYTFAYSVSEELKRRNN